MNIKFVKKIYFIDLNVLKVFHIFDNALLWNTSRIKYNTIFSIRSESIDSFEGQNKLLNTCLMTEIDKHKHQFISPNIFYVLVFEIC